jgi:hypothetical protein
MSRRDRKMVQSSGSPHLATWTAVQRTQLSEFGVVKVAGAIPRNAAEAMADRLWSALARGGADRADPSTWASADLKAVKQASQRGAFNAYASAAVIAVADDLLGAGAWRPLQRWGFPMITFPQRGSTWTVPAAGWHLDGSPRNGVAEREVRTFALLAPHLPGGGGTLVVAGSHRLVTALADEIAHPSRSTATAVAKKALSTHPWFRELFDSEHQPGRLDRLMNDGAVVSGVPVRVVEFTGGPGDLFVMHPWTLHAVSPNCGNAPRLMLMTSLFDAAHPLLDDHGAGDAHPPGGLARKQ